LDVTWKQFTFLIEIHHYVNTNAFTLIARSLLEALLNIIYVLQLKDVSFVFWSKQRGFSHAATSLPKTAKFVGTHKKIR